MTRVACFQHRPFFVISCFLFSKIKNFLLLFSKLYVGFWSRKDFGDFETLQCPVASGMNGKCSVLGKEETMGEIFRFDFRKQRRATLMRIYTQMTFLT